MELPLSIKASNTSKKRTFKHLPSEKIHHWVMETTHRDTRTIGVDTKNLIAQSLLQQSYSGHLRHEALIKAAQQFGVCKKTVHRIWAEAKEQMERGVPVNV